MKDVIRKYLWKLLGNKYQVFLKNQKGVYLDDFKTAVVGENSYNNGAKVWKWNNNSELTIGKYCSIANDVDFILDSGNHNIFTMTTYPIIQNLYHNEERFTFRGKSYNRETFSSDYIPTKRSILIKNEVWIGAGVTVLPGVTIGNGAIILSGSIVSKSVDDFSIVSGVPAKHIRYRFPEEYHKDLLNIAWWDWNSEKVKYAINDFELDVQDFINKHI